jgi:polyprenyl-phospho-N-acetylgalactosaminyl synthase
MVDEKVWLVIPAFNEAAVIAETVRAARSVVENAVVVDDCSSDATGAEALAAGAHVCRHPVNLGQGAALQTGIDYAVARGAERIVTFDADGQHRPSDIITLLATMDQRRCDVVLGSRFLGEACGISQKKRLFLQLATIYTKATTHLSITDTHNGLRVLSRRAAKKIRLKQNRMAHASEILNQIADEKLSYVEAPCTITYSDYSKAKGQKMTGAFTILFDLFLRRLYR